jgi:hypothetical protein
MCAQKQASRLCDQRYSSLTHEVSLRLVWLQVFWDYALVRPDLQGNRGNIFGMNASTAALVKAFVDLDPYKVRSMMYTTLFMCSYSLLVCRMGWARCARAQDARMYVVPVRDRHAPLSGSNC